MPLDPVLLTQGILALYHSKPPTIPAAAQGLAAAYTAYASVGVFLAGVLPSLEAQNAALEQTLLAAMVAKGPSAAYAAAWSAGLTVYWLGAAVAGVNAGATVGCPGAAAAEQAILVSLQSAPTTVEQAANDLANALHAATATVTATVSIPAPPFTGVVPIV
jgi:hypothetical protein